MKKPIKTALLRDLEIQLSKEEISYSRMVEILNEKSLEYTKECVKASLEKASENAETVQVKYTNDFEVDKKSITNPDNIVLL